MIIKIFNYLENYELYQILNIVENNRLPLENLVIINV